MKVYVVVGTREGVEYEDPGADEVLSIHATREGAEEMGRKMAPWGPDIGGYETVHVEESEVLP